jgi:hypothetical protein
MGLMSFFSRLDRWAGRFNDWFGATAVAAHSETPGAGGRPQVDPTSVVALLGEMENEDRIRDDDPD